MMPTHLVLPPPGPTTAPDFFTADELARRWKVSPDTVWRWSRQCRLPQPVPFGRILRWRAEDVRQLERNGGLPDPPKSNTPRKTAMRTKSRR